MNVVQNCAGFAKAAKSVMSAIAALMLIKPGNLGPWMMDNQGGGLI